MSNIDLTQFDRPCLIVRQVHVVVRKYINRALFRDYFYTYARRLHRMRNASVLRTGKYFKAYISLHLASACRAAPLISLIKLATDRPACSISASSLPLSVISVIYTFLRINFWSSYFSSDFLDAVAYIFLLRFASMSLSVNVNVFAVLKNIPYGFSSILNSTILSICRCDNNKNFNKHLRVFSRWILRLQKFRTL